MLLRMERKGTKFLLLLWNLIVTLRPTRHKEAKPFVDSLDALAYSTTLDTIPYTILCYT